MLILGRTTRKHGSAVQKWYSQVCPGWERLSHVSYATSCMCMKKAMTTTDGSCQPGVLCPPSGKKGWASWFVQKRWPALQNQLSILSLSCFLNRCKYSMSTALILAYRARGKLLSWRQEQNVYNRLQIRQTKCQDDDPGILKQIARDADGQKEQARGGKNRRNSPIPEEARNE